MATLHRILQNPDPAFIEYVNDSAVREALKVVMDPTDEEQVEREQHTSDRSTDIVAKPRVEYPSRGNTRNRQDADIASSEPAMRQPPPAEGSRGLNTLSMTAPEGDYATPGAYFAAMGATPTNFPEPGPSSSVDQPEARLPLKGILKPPKEKFPEEEDPIWKAVARLKDSDAHRRSPDQVDPVEDQSAGSYNPMQLSKEVKDALVTEFDSEKVPGTTKSNNIDLQVKDSDKDIEIHGPEPYQNLDGRRRGQRQRLDSDGTKPTMKAPPTAYHAPRGLGF